MLIHRSPVCFIGERHFCDRQSAFFAEPEQILGRSVHIRHRRAGIGAGIRFAIAHREASANRKPNFARDGVAGVIEGFKAHGVGMTIESLEVIEDDVVRGIEGNFASIRKRQALRSLDFREAPLGVIGIERIRNFAGEAQNDRLIRRVTFSGPGERSENGRPHARDFWNGLAQAAQKKSGRLHGTDGVRRGWADADLE